MKTIFTILTIAAFSGLIAQGISFNELQNWSGSGNKVAMLIVDFNDGSDDCYAFGFRFNGQATAENMLHAISQQNPEFQIIISGGFLMDITYNNHQGLGGNPYYWATFTWINGTWSMNMGISEPLQDSIIFGCSYTDWDSLWNPINLPENPKPAPASTSITKYNNSNIFAFYTETSICIQADKPLNQIEFFTLSGHLIYSEKTNSNSVCIDTRKINNGIYIIRIKNQYYNHYIKIFINS